MTLIFSTRQGAVVLTALALLFSPAAMAQSVPATVSADTASEWARPRAPGGCRLDWKHQAGWFAGVTGTILLDRRYEEVPGVQMPGVLFTGSVVKMF